MATIWVESGFSPTVVNAAGRRDGLMQVIPQTVTSMLMLYGLDVTQPQTDAYTSILTGVCYMDYTIKYLEKRWGVNSVPLSAVIEGYNEGAGAAAQGKMVPAYWYDWAAAQQTFAFVDTIPTVTV
jgi:soluble lytic murein transglycosylase-like protein